MRIAPGRCLIVPTYDMYFAAQRSELRNGSTDSSKKNNRRSSGDHAQEPDEGKGTWEGRQEMIGGRHI